MESGSRRAHVLPSAWALLLGLLLLGPSVWPSGYLLSYDMVWVPDLALRTDFLGFGTALPRAVPSDAVVAVLDEVLPGALLQSVVLLGALVAAGAGAAVLLREVAGDRTGLSRRALLAGELAATSWYVWSPFAVERLWIGQWPVLVAYAALPWLVLGAIRTRREGWSALLWLLPLGCLSATSGIATTIAVLVLGVTLRHRGRSVGLVALCLAGNAPWLVAGLLHAADARSAASGVWQFGLAAEGGVPAPLAALTTGGIWNSEVVPGSRTGAWGWLALVLALCLATLGVLALRRTDRRTLAGLAACWLVGYAVAVTTWLVPDAVGQVAAVVPGAGVLRDGSRLLLLGAPLLALLAGAGSAWLVARVPGALGAGPRLLLGAAGVLLPVMVMTDAAWGIGGALQRTDYPDDFTRAAAVLDAGAPGDVVLLPFESYRAPEWNGHRRVLDPMGRLQPRDYVANDDLAINSSVLPGEDPRAEAVQRALALESPQARAARLAELGIGFAVLDRTALGQAASARTHPPVAGEVLLSSPDVTVTRVAGEPAARAIPLTNAVSMTLAWVCFVAPFLGAGMAAVRRTASRRKSAHVM